MRIPHKSLLLAAMVACNRAPAPRATPAPPAPAPRAKATTPATTEPARPDLRLGGDVRPLRYDLDLTLVPDKDDFGGVVEIDLEIRREVSAIVLHAADLLKVESATLIVGEETLAGRPTAMPSELLSVGLPRAVAPGKARLRIAYRGALPRNEADGIYQEVDDGHHYIYTQFESTDARRAFPCFDEPSFKVPWKLTLHVPAQHVAVTNTPAQSETGEPDGMKAVRFTESRPLPSYLVAFAVGPFDVVDAGTAGRKRTPVRVITPRGKAAEARWAVESTGPILERLEAYFDIPYPFEKLDSIAVPNKGGAMENPGLVTYGTGLILSGAHGDTISRQRRYAEVCAHELAHMWFGDLVTMAWWDDLWLNEAFATWMARRTITEWKPAWGGEASRVTSRASAMSADSLLTARQIRQPIVVHDDIESAFDGITYSKGAAVIVMFERWLGAEVFQRGVRRYMREHAYGNATAAEFLAAVTAEAGRDVAPAFASFLDQPGVPLVRVSLLCQESGPAIVGLSQERYRAAGAIGGADPVWQVPVCVEHPGGQACTLLTERRAELPLTGQGCPAWIQANDGMTGYYRVSYKDDLWKRLLAGAAPALTLPERIGMVDDVRALVESGEIAHGDALELVPPLAKSADRQLVSAALGLVTSTSDHLLADDARPAYAAFIRDTFGKRARALGWKSHKKDDEDTRILRAALVGVVASEGEDHVLVVEATRLTRAWLANRRAVEQEVLDDVLAVAAQNGDRALFDKLVAAARTTKDRKERGQLYRAIGSFRDPALMSAALALVLADGLDVRETRTIYARALGDRVNREVGYDFLKQNFDRITARLPRSSRSRMVSSADVFCDKAHRDDVAAFFGARDATARTLAQTLERIDLCAALREAQAPSVNKFFRTERTPADVAAPPRSARRTRSGLAYRVIKKGTGKAHPHASSQVEVHYSGWTTDGKLFDSSRQRGQPATFPLDAVIPGWSEGVKLMVEGETTRFWIPESLAYQGKPGPPAGMLVFDVELIRIVD